MGVGAVIMHPKGNNEHPQLQWTAPYSGTLVISGKTYGIDGGDSTVWILHNQLVLGKVRGASFSYNIYVNTGDIVTFGADWGINLSYGMDGIGMDATLLFDQVVPQYIVSTLAGNGTSGYSNLALAVNSMMNQALGMRGTTAGNVYVADTGNSLLRLLNTTTGALTTIAGVVGSAGYSGDTGAATSAKLNGPSGVVQDAAGGLYVADSLNSRVRYISTANVITTYAGTATSGYSGDGGAATLAMIKTPYGLALANGILYFSEINSNRVRAVTVSSGIISTVAGNGTSGFAGDGGQATAAILGLPRGIAVGLGILYIADFDNNRVRNVNLATGIINTFAGSGAIRYYSGGYSGDGGLATSATLAALYDVAVDSVGNVLISDSSNCVVRFVSATSGIINTVAGTGNQCSYNGNGVVATTALFSYPSALSLDSTGSVFLYDRANERVRKLTTYIPPSVTSTPTGTVTPTSTFTPSLTTTSTKSRVPTPTPSSTCGHNVAAGIPFTPGNLVAVRIGGGSTSLTTSTTAFIAREAFLDEFPLEGGAVVQSIAFPTTSSGSQLQCTVGTGSVFEGVGTTSGNGGSFVMPCWQADVGAGFVSVTPHVVAVVSSSGTIDTSTSFIGASTFEVGATSPDGVSLYTSGQAGTTYVAFGNPGTSRAAKTGAVSLNAGSSRGIQWSTSPGMEGYWDLGASSNNIKWGAFVGSTGTSTSLTNLATTQEFSVVVQGGGAVWTGDAPANGIGSTTSNPLSLWACTSSACTKKQYAFPSFINGASTITNAKTGIRALAGYFPTTTGASYTLLMTTSPTAQNSGNFIVAYDTSLVGTSGFAILLRAACPFTMYSGLGFAPLLLPSFTSTSTGTVTPATTRSSSVTPSYTASSTGSSSPTPTSTPTSSSLPPPSPIFVFHFDGDYTDSTGNMAGLTAVNSQPFVDGVNGGLAAAFTSTSSSNTYLTSVTPLSQLPSGATPRTVMVWVKASSIPNPYASLCSWGSLGVYASTSILMFGNDLYGFGGWSYDDLQAASFSTDVWYRA